MPSTFQLKSKNDYAEGARADGRNTIEGMPIETAGDDIFDIIEAASGSFVEAYSNLARNMREAFPQTASFENLVLHGRRYIGDPHPATKASGTATAGGNEAAAWTSGLYLTHPASSRRYVTTAGGVIGGGSGTVALQDVAGGDAGWMAEGEQLIFESPPPGVNPTVTVVSMQGGADAEKEDAYRNRLLDALRRPQAGGTLADFETWVAEIPGVGAVKAFAHLFGLGTCGVLAIDPEGDDLSDDVFAAAQANLDAKRPCTALGSLVVRPTRVPLNLEFSVVISSTYAFSDTASTTVAPGSTDATVKVASTVGFAVGDWIAFPNLFVARRIVTIDVGAGALIVDPKLPAAPVSGDPVIPGNPTYDEMAGAVVDLVRGIAPGAPYYKDGGEGAVREHLDVESARQTSPAGDVTPVVSEATKQALKLRSVTIVEA